jgi:hypothetical protein
MLGKERKHALAHEHAARSEAAMIFEQKLAHRTAGTTAEGGHATVYVRELLR